MKNKSISEISLIAIVAIPFIYLAYIWNSLPEKVPVHWNIEGEIDRYGEKWELLIIPILLPLLTYVILILAPAIDPKGKLAQMGKKYGQLKNLLVVFMTVLATYILYSAKTASISSPNTVILLIGVLYIIIGNYAKTLKPNYFIGIRTPWTLESPEVWKRTHLVAGKLWFIGGILVTFCSIFFAEKTSMAIFFAITAIICIIPFIHSFIMHRNLKAARELNESV